MPTEPPALLPPLQHRPDAHHATHLAEARRVLALPIEASGLRWHPFGLYTLPLANRTRDGRVWSRRLHVWHPEARPVGHASPYGVHTHTGTAESHVLAGALDHHLYAFEADPDGPWRESVLGGGERTTRLVAHAQAGTVAGTTHTLPAHQPHGVSKSKEVFAVSLFEQADTDRSRPFTTWQRTDVPAEPLVRTPPVPVRVVQAEALSVLDAAATAAGPLVPRAFYPLRRSPDLPHDDRHRDPRAQQALR